METPHEEPIQYEVIVSDTAEWEARQARESLAQSVSVEYADRWLEGLVRQFGDLALFPRRHPIARENDRYVVELRRMLYYGPNRRSAQIGSIYRILFYVAEARSREDTATVHILSVRHGARQPDED